MSQPPLAQLLDATLLTADATSARIDALAHEARRLSCAAVCVHPIHVSRAVRALGGASVRVASVAGFPLGASPVGAKIAECRHALDAGATELDIVLPIWAVMDDAAGAVDEEIAALLAATAGATRKLIIEMGVLTESRLGMVASILNRRLPEMAKTGTGYARHVTAADVETLRGLLDPRIGIKAAGGVRTRALAESLVRAGASRIGTSCPADVLA